MGVGEEWGDKIIYYDVIPRLNCLSEGSILYLK